MPISRAGCGVISCHFNLFDWIMPSKVDMSLPFTKTMLEPLLTLWKIGPLGFLAPFAKHTFV